MSPSRMKSCQSRTPSASSAMCLGSTAGQPSSTTIRGRQTRPASAATLTVRCVGCSCTETNSPRRPQRRRRRREHTNTSGSRWMPSSMPLMNTSVQRLSVPKSKPASRCTSSTPKLSASRLIGASSSSVVTCVVSAKFLTRPHASPSGVSDGQSMPHCDGCSERGPETLRVFSNWDMMRVIMPSAEMKERRERTCVTPERSILKRFTDQLPVEMACEKPSVMVSCRMHLAMSNWAARVGFERTWSACRLSSAQSFLKRSSKRRERSWPASSSRLLP
mmetsp:Transcript_34960/g.87210  ORF Transcript_34960/g.87210 Transcript_34960/m.87210 type:complete len:276 (-) Transcript_34960:1173-2000(-)